MYRPENTDSEFWNLTADDESQIDPVQVMRNLNSTNVLSAGTSLIQIQEADNKTNSMVPSQPTKSGKNSILDSAENKESPVKRQFIYSMVDKTPSSAIADVNQIEILLVQKDGMITM